MTTFQSTMTTIAEVSDEPSNAQSAFDNYLLWLKHSPGDYKGATDAASDFIDDLDDMDEFEKLMKNAAGIAI